MRSLTRLVLSFVILCSAGASSPNASVLNDLWSVVIDPLKLKTASEEVSGSVDRTLEGLRALEGKANEDISKRIEQIRQIVLEVLDAFDRKLQNIDEVVARAAARMKELERQTYKDAVDLIYRARCAAEVTLRDTVQRSMADMIDNLIKADPNVKILGIKIVTVGIKKIEITDPDLAYMSTKKAYFSLLKQIKQTDPAILILSRYQNLQRFASFAQCHFIDQGMAILFLEEKAGLEVLSRPWLNVVRLKIF